MTERAYTVEEMQEITTLATKCMTAIERSNWTEQPLTPMEKSLIDMAVGWTFYELRIRTEKKPADAI